MSTHNAFILEDGSFIAWGDNQSNQCNIPDTHGRAFVQVSAGSEHNVAILDDGECIAWGDNGHGQCNIPDIQCCKFVQVSA